MEDFEAIKKNVNILLVDDDIDYIQVTAFYLKTKGYNIDIATSGSDAIEKVSRGDIHVVLLDYYMPELTGEDVVNKIREFNDNIIIILQTGFAGQQPPEETLKRLNIQNYHDKSDGVEKLLLQVTAAVRIFYQQNLIELSKYKVNAMGRLVRGIAEELKAPLLSIEASVEATKALTSRVKEETNDDVYNKIEEAYSNSKLQIEKIDKICKTLLTQTSDSGKKNGITVRDIMDTLKLMLLSELKAKNIVLEENIGTKLDTYIYGNVDDIIFIVCELIQKIVENSNYGDTIKISVTENDSAFYISLNANGIKDVKKTNVFLIKNIVGRMDNTEFEEVGNGYVIELKK